MSDCTDGEMRDLLPELLHGTLPADVQRTVESHVASCTACAEELTLLRALRASLADKPAVDVSRIAAGVVARLSMPPRRVPAPGPRRAPWRMAIAAAALLAAGGAGYLLTSHRGGEPHLPPVAAHTGGPAAGEIVQAPVSAPAASSRAPVPASTPASTPESAGSGVLGDVADLSDDDVRALASSLDGLSSAPDAEPEPELDPLGSFADDASGISR
jgi:anti-sigma factor RsiW